MTVKNIENEYKVGIQLHAIKDHKVAGEQFRLLRMKSGMSQRAVAQKAGYANESQVSNLENGRWYPSRWDGYVTLARFLQAIDVDVTEFVEACNA